LGWLVCHDLDVSQHTGTTLKNGTVASINLLPWDLPGTLSGTANMSTNSVYNAKAKAI